ncbi:RNA polymerase sigma factor (plasmid) [Burkholderia sp. FERM BP-3421]|uniref:RNA polymerase sigma factor n=1 Tax=Burkholderia sp. FERM BP-3421 TaxID=1494466 RepID=UPI00235E10E0|nr:RNA polymerase sigma factor [Burkholderia sp. FERM BP-3421]WDD90354.1 RNA polymerase sigma factor [Burkholderia sp. FERM BP-3421]
MIDELVLGYHRLRRRLALELGPDDAADIAQEAFERTLRYMREHGDRVLSPVGLLVRIALNLQIDRGRRRKHLPVALDESYEDPSWNVTPEDEAAGKQALMQLFADLDRLPPRCREAFILCRLYGLTYQEAAEQMGIQPSVVREYLVDAMRACRDGQD